MTRRPPIAACALALAVCVMPLGRAAELVTLRNGFQIQCDHHATAGASIRIYLTAGNDDYIELPPAQIAFVSQAAAPAIPPAANPAVAPAQPIIPPASSPAIASAQANAVLKGHDFSRAAKSPKLLGPLGPEGNGSFTKGNGSLKEGNGSFTEGDGGFNPRIRQTKSGGFSPGGYFARPQPALTPADLRQMLANAGRSHNLDVDLLASVVHAESGGNPTAVSRAGARGLMQLMPSTAAHLGVRNSFQPRQNVGGGSAYLDALLTRYSNNLALALAAYNAGPEAVDRYRGIPPYPETRAYVARVIHEFNRRVLVRRGGLARRAAAQALPHKLHAAVSQR